MPRGSRFQAADSGRERQRAARAVAGKGGEIGKEVVAGFGVVPDAVCPAVVEAASARRHPDFVQGALQVDDELAAVGEGERHLRKASGTRFAFSRSTTGRSMAQQTPCGRL